MKPLPDAGTATPLVLKFDDNRLLGAVFGEHDRNLARIEKALGVMVSSRGNRVAISGSAGAQRAAGAVLTNLYQQVRGGHYVNDMAVSGAIS